jgi:hypothetical protein
MDLTGPGTPATPPQARRAPGELHDPDERVRAYEAMRAHVSAETAEEASSGLQPDEDAQRSYRNEAPQLLETRADQDKRSAGERQADRSADPPEPDRPRGDLQLSKGRDAETTAAIGRVRETEPTISSDVRAVERRTGTAAGWKASTATSKAKTASRKRSPRSWLPSLA